MSKFIDEPIHNKDWDPTKGDFFSESVYEEDKRYKFKLFKYRIKLFSILFIYIVLLIMIFNL